MNHNSSSAKLFTVVLLIELLIIKLINKRNLLAGLKCLVKNLELERVHHSRALPAGSVLPERAR